MDLTASDQVEQAARCLLLLSQNTVSRKATTDLYNSNISIAGLRNDSLKKQSSQSPSHHFPHPSCVRQYSTGDFSGSDRQSPSSCSDSCSRSPDHDVSPGDRVSQSGCRSPAGLGGEGAVDLSSGFRTRSNGRSDGVAAGRAPIPSVHHHFARLTHKTNDNLLRYSTASHVKQRPDHDQQRLVSGSLSDHSPFMIARIMTDLNQYRQQEPMRHRLSPHIMHVAGQDQEENRGSGHQSLEPGNQKTLSGSTCRSSRRLPPFDLSDVSEDRGSGGAADPLLSLMQQAVTSAAVDSAGISSTSACERRCQQITSDQIRTTAGIRSKKRKAGARDGTAGKRQRSRLGSGGEDGGDDGVDGGGLVQGVSGKKSESGVNRSNERQCKHACAFPGCHKVYGKSCNFPQSPTCIYPSSSLLSLVCASQRNRRSSAIIISLIVFFPPLIFTGKSSHLKSHFRSHTGSYAKSLLYVQLFPPALIPCLTPISHVDVGPSF